MLTNEVGNDSAATAVKKAVNDNALINEFAESLSEPKTWLVGGAAAAATIAATVAAAKYGLPLLEAARTAVSDLTVAGAIKGGAAGAQTETRFMTPALDALTERSAPIAMRDATRGETGILGVVKNGRIDPNADTITVNTFRMKGSGAGTMDAATDAIVSNGIPIRSSLPTEAPVRHSKLVFTEDGSWVTRGGDPAHLADQNVNPLTRSSAVRALAERMPKPATEADITAMAGRLAPPVRQAEFADALDGGVFIRRPEHNFVIPKPIVEPLSVNESRRVWFKELAEKYGFKA